MVMAVGLVGASVAAPFNVWRTAALGLTLGGAILTKTTLIVLHPLLCVWIFAIWIQSRVGVKGADFANLAKQIFVMTVAAWFVINSGYGWEGFGARLGDFEFISSRLNGNDASVVKTGNLFEGTLLGSIPVILPKSFVLGIDTQYRDFEGNFFYPYLLGRWYREGFATFYFWYFFLKLPVGFLCLIVIGAVAIGFRLIDIRNKPLFGLTTVMGVVLFAFLSWRTDLNYCQRYAIICLPSLCLCAAAASSMFRTKPGSIVYWVFIGTTAGVGMWYSPHALSYYNGFVGGPEGGRYCLHGNATDWGQDSIRIGDWCSSHPERRPLAIATVGFPSSLEAYGVQADSLRFETDLRAAWDDSIRGKKVFPVGWHIVSFVHLLDPRSPYHDLLHQTPTESIGWTHQVFYIDAQWAELLTKRGGISLPGEEH